VKVGFLEESHVWQEYFSHFLSTASDLEVLQNFLLFDLEGMRRSRCALFQNDAQ
jgi:hypothetical protein